MKNLEKQRALIFVFQAEDGIRDADVTGVQTCALPISIKKDESLLERTLEEGYERAVLCVHCHGEDGNSKRDRIPNLASQNSEYLFIQFEHFRSEERRVGKECRYSGAPICLKQKQLYVK